MIKKIKAQWNKVEIYFENWYKITKNVITFSYLYTSFIYKEVWQKDYIKIPTKGVIIELSNNRVYFNWFRYETEKVWKDTN